MLSLTVRYSSYFSGNGGLAVRFSPDCSGYPARLGVLRWLGFEVVARSDGMPQTVPPPRPDWQIIAKSGISYINTAG
ncbi:hypothetical protein [Psychrobacter pygoscelis]|uniref:hypothetical protein n=1 Tax=Psychrobacter pygoscelis TaxID=2488563 RepID=UPI00104007AC|nr:hypothetical protein [Psychrobacter pygoscelis]